ncbi:hypothetical protein IPL85_06120 [Candidatus Saccharibacteria bacterium]|nr:MAG: hypothetical protein IPL85_06120 [Candidatus Saccharibacteria bacterium]
MPEDKKIEDSNETTQPIIVVGSSSSPQVQLQAPAPSVTTEPVRHRFAETYVVISLVALLVMVSAYFTPLVIVLVYIGAVPLGVIGLPNLLVIPLLLAKKFLSGKYKVMGIMLLVLSILAVAAGVFFIHNVRSIESKWNKKIDQTIESYKEQEATARSNATVEQATQLLNSCQVFGFYYTKQDGTNGAENAEKTSTGILLYKMLKSFDDTTTPSSGDAGKYRMHIADSMVNTMVPVARNAQHSCGIQFWHDGNYEQYKDGKWYFNGQVVQNVDPGKSKEEAISFMQNCKADYFVGYTDINLVKDSSTRAWLDKAEKSTTGIEISEGSPKSYVFASKSMTTALQDTARQFRQSCYSKKKLYITIDNWIETEYPQGNWTKVNR